ncbi:uncharacterized protein LOC111133615 [Crassostrea virginica]|uniref:Uncharacterized protein LOC111133615 n=1 Tax=Crassostrea virginica TaxID=6565 RepID=A0A8B8EB18_CRAVI|nr:uncharacterized protein LOC111133615 [Crassostrea virginica]XP_022337848.1 uncharacterized protein LOC111133616 [Crassostrea virginica]
MQFSIRGQQSYDTLSSSKDHRSKNKDSETGLADQYGYILTSPKDYRAEAIFATIFCFLPLGLVALFYSTRVKIHYKNNRLIAAYSSSKVAQVLSIAATIIGLVLWFGGTIAYLTQR